MITEKNFVRQILKGNEKALLYVIDNYGGLVKSVVHRHLYQLTAEEEECINDVFMAVWEHVDSFDEKKNSFKNWIAAIARYKAIDYLRKNLSRLEERALEDTDMISIESVERAVLEQTISEETEHLLSCLNEADREILMKCYMEEQSVEEIGIEYHLKTASVYSRISRAKAKIRLNASQKNENPEGRAIL